MTVLLGLIGLLVFAGGIFQLLARRLYGYVLRPGKIQIVLLGFIPVGFISLRGIAEMREVSLDHAWSPDPMTLGLANRLFGRFLELRRNAGLIRRILITPDDPDAFIRAWEAAKREPRAT